MLTITKGLDFSCNHTIYDDREGGVESDLRGYVVRSQIRANVAVDQTYPLVMDVDVNMSGPKLSQMELHLSAAETMSMSWGDYLIDVVASKDGKDEFLIRKEPIKVVGHVTLPNDPDDIPNFVEIFETALTD